MPDQAREVREGFLEETTSELAWKDEWGVGRKTGVVFTRDKTCRPSRTIHGMSKKCSILEAGMKFKAGAEGRICLEEGIPV